MATSHWLSLEVDASPMRTLCTRPAMGDVLPGVVVAMHAPGIDAFMERMAEQLADAGFAAIVPDVYHRQDEASGEGPLERMGRLQDDELFRDLAAAAAALRMQPGVAPRRVSVIGFCMGGRIAWLQLARDASLRCGVCFYPGSVDCAWGGPTDARTALDWGKAIRQPVLGIFGAEDSNPSPAHRAAMAEVLATSGIAHELREFAGCGHAFLNFMRPSYRQAQAEDAWSRCIAWLREHSG